jgi:ubiquinone biosynthesis protein UbiJ
MLPAAPIVFALNHLLQGASWARQRLQGFAGRRLGLAIGPWSLGLAVSEAGLFIAAAPEAVDVRIELPAAAPFLLLQDMDRLLHAARIDGHAEFAETLGFVLRHLDWDVEADLAAVFGDLLAHRLVACGRALRQHLACAAVNLAVNLGEYGQYEAGLLAIPGEVDAFNGAVSVLVDDAARLEKRLAVLEKRQAARRPPA